MHSIAELRRYTTHPAVYVIELFIACLLEVR